MDRDELHRSWERTEALLKRAQQALPPAQPEDVADLGWYFQYLMHNELGLAFHDLVFVARDRGAGPECWRALSLAADSMRIDSADPDHGEAAELVREHLR
jgi:hypothetical protein